MTSGVATAAILLLLAISDVAAQNRPNVVLIYADAGRVPSRMDAQYVPSCSM
jgi:hypothetical protein